MSAAPRQRRGVFGRRVSAARPVCADDHRVELLEGAREFFAALIRDVDAALSDIQFETYIFDCTGAGAQVAEAFIRAAQRGVRVQVAVDGVGCMGGLPAPWPQRLADAGVQWQVYSPPGRFGLLRPARWRRLHRKLCVVDGCVLYCGGINVLDDFHDPNHGALQAPRFDFAVRVVGSLVNEAGDAMEQLWWRMRAVHDARERRLGQALADLRAASVARLAAGHPPQAAAAHGMRAMLVLRDNLRHRSRIEQAYLRAIGTARQ